MTQSWSDNSGPRPLGPHQRPLTSPEARRRRLRRFTNSNLYVRSTSDCFDASCCLRSRQPGPQSIRRSQRRRVGTHAFQRCARSPCVRCVWRNAASACNPPRPDRRSRERSHSSQVADFGTGDDGSIRPGTRADAEDACTPADQRSCRERGVIVRHATSRRATARTPSVLLCKQGVVGSSPIVSTAKLLVRALQVAPAALHGARRAIRVPLPCHKPRYLAFRRSAADDDSGGGIRSAAVARRGVTWRRYARS